MRAIAWLTLACFLPATQAGAGDARSVSPPPENNLPEIAANENRSPAGQLREGVLTINIAPDDPLLRVSLLSGTAPLNWRAVAKDGAALPPAQATLRPARQVVSVEETYDFDFEPASSGEFCLEVFRPALPFLKRPEQRINVAVRVR